MTKWVPKEKQHYTLQLMAIQVIPFLSLFTSWSHICVCAVSIAVALLKYGADFNIRDGSGKTAKEKAITHMLHAFKGKIQTKVENELLTNILLSFFFPIKKGVRRVQVKVIPINDELLDEEFNPTTIGMNSISTLKTLIVRIESNYGRKVADIFQRNGDKIDGSELDSFQLGQLLSSTSDTTIVFKVLLGEKLSAFKLKTLNRIKTKD